MPETPLLDIANASGFPFQIAVERLVRETEDSHGWTVQHREHGWAFEADYGFIDLVLRHQSGRKFLAVECKRVRDASWIFLPFDGDPRMRRHINAWVSWYDGDRQPVFEWCDLSGEPSSPEASFCAMRGQDSSGQRSLLERVGGELISSTEALAREQRDFRVERKPDLKIYSSVIVTNVPLVVARFKPADISLKNGEIAGAEFQEVPCVRFRKQLAARNEPLTPEDFKRAQDGQVRAREHTIFVVHASGLVNFLSAFSFDNGPLSSLGVSERAP